MSASAAQAMMEMASTVWVEKLPVWMRTFVTNTLPVFIMKHLRSPFVFAIRATMETASSAIWQQNVAPLTTAESTQSVMKGFVCARKDMRGTFLICEYLTFKT